MNETSGQNNASNSQLEGLQTAPEIAALLRIHPVTLLRWAREGRIPHRRLGARKIVFIPAEIADWLRSGAKLYTVSAVRAASTKESEAA